MSNSNVGKYVGLAALAAGVAGVTWLALHIKKHLKVIRAVLETLSEFDTIYEEHGAEAGKAEAVKRFKQRSEDRTGPWVQQYQENLEGHWDRYVQGKATEAETPVTE